MKAWLALTAGFLIAGPSDGIPSDRARGEGWTFNTDPAGAAPAGFAFGRTGHGRTGRWDVRTVKDAPSPPNVLAQVEDDRTSDRFPVAVVADLSFRDLRLSVMCKPVSGEVDQACGLVFRYRNENNYYVARANALEGNVRLYFVKGGSRRQIADARATVTVNAWHELAVEVRGARFEVWWDGRKILLADDGTFREAGRVGLWTKADSVTYFDDLMVRPLPMERPSS